MYTTTTLADPTAIRGLLQSAVQTLSLWPRPARDARPAPSTARHLADAAAIVPPAGLITLLFTDIEGSTDLVRRLGDGYAPVLLAHGRLLRRAARAWRGYEVDSQGDAFLFAFQTVADAVSAAIRMQRDIIAALPEVRVRMGVHSGEPSLIDGRYIGLDVHRAARVAAAAHGGQIILSDAAYDLVASQMPDDATTRDLGEHRLKDLHRSRRLYQLMVPGLPDAFPPPRTLNAHRHNLPTPTTPLIGRQADTCRLKSLLAETATRLVTLTGPGGVGKTRLALQVAAESVADFPAGVFFVPLGDIRDAHGVAAAIAQALDLPVPGDETALDLVVAHLRERRALLVLDNFEQVVAAGPDVTALLVAAPGVKALVTSRLVLRVYGEREFTVPTLSAPLDTDGVAPTSLTRYPAVELFVQRAQAVRPDFGLTPDNAAAVAAICARLDGLPLAIELAAARSRLLSPQAILAQLQRGRLQILSRGMLDLPARQQTLRASIDWSHDLLETTWRAVFRRLAVFSGGFSLDAAVAVCADGSSAEHGGLTTADVVDAVEALLDASLLHPHGDPHGEACFAMLETVREYALERLDEAGERALAQTRHAALVAPARRARRTWAERAISPAPIGRPPLNFVAWMSHLQRGGTAAPGIRRLVARGV